MTEMVSPTSVRFEEMNWPRPDVLDELNHKLRYGDPTRSDLLSAASVLSAYSALFWKTGKDAAHIIRTVKRMLREVTP